MERSDNELTRTPGDTAELVGSSKQLAYPSEEVIRKVAEICHEANRAVCATNGDLSQPSWADAPEWQKQSAIAGVKFHIERPHASPRDSHDNWMEGKLRDGWRYGATKDADRKEHPCLLPYAALPLEERVKDDVFRAIVRGYLGSIRNL